MPSPEPLVDLRRLVVTGPAGRVVGPLDLRIEPGERVGLVGASGSGKTLTTRAVLGRLPAGLSAHADPGSVICDPSITGALFQEAALEPLVRVGRQVGLPLRASGVGRTERDVRARAMLEQLDLDPALASARPLELSGGQRQRVALALAMIRGPRLLIADEPTSALDVVTAQSVLRSILSLIERAEAALLLVTHDLGLARALCTRIAVLDEGRICDEGPSDSLFDKAVHPATRRLLDASGRLRGSE